MNIHELTHTEEYCKVTSSRLSEYLNGELSAHDTWLVEKHLALCRECESLAHTTQLTVELLKSADKLEPSDHFMANLHTRLDGVASVKTSWEPVLQLRTWIIRFQDQLNRKRVSILSFGMATVVIAACIASFRPIAPTEGFGTVARTSADSVSQDALSRHVAVTASNPFDDPVAAKLEAETPGTDSSARSNTE